ncbi:MAG: ATP-binding protein [Spirochaetota bacterium]
MGAKKDTDVKGKDTSTDALKSKYAIPVKDRAEQRQYKLPSWFKELTADYVVKKKGVFVLYHNIFDYVILENESEPVKLMLERHVRDFLHNDLVRYSGPGPFRAVLTYSLTGELGTFTQDEKDFWETSLKLQNRVQLEGHLTPAQIRIPPSEEDTISLGLVENIMRADFRGRQNEPRRVTVFVDYFHHLVPEAERANVNSRNVEFIRRMANDSSVEEIGNLFIAFTDDKNLLYSDLSNESGVVFLEIPSPSKETKLKFLYFLRSKRDEAKSETGETKPAFSEIPGLSIIKPEPFARDEADCPDEQRCLEYISERTSGFTLKELDEINRWALYEDWKAEKDNGEPLGITPDIITSKRRAFLHKKSGKLLVEVEPRGDFDSVGGLDSIKKYFREIAGEMKIGKTEKVPKAVLLTGPPGTGKSIIAEAFAYESKVPMVSLGQFRSMYVGETERQFEVAIGILKDMAPVVVFVDEYDQMISQRAKTGSGDAHATDQRVFGRILQIMGDNKYRGKMVWLAASNRPDKLDPAQLRRFDRIFPVLLPYSNIARAKIFEAMSHGVIKGLEYGDGIKGNNESETFNNLLKIAKMVSKYNYTGSEIEQLLRLAISMTGAVEAPGEDDKYILTLQNIKDAIEKYAINHDDTLYEYYSLLSIRMCNNTDDLPNPDEEGVPDSMRDLIVDIIKNKSMAKVDEQIDNLKVKIHIKDT